MKVSVPFSALARNVARMVGDTSLAKALRKQRRAATLAIASFRPACRTRSVEEVFAWKGILGLHVVIQAIASSSATRRTRRIASLVASVDRTCARVVYGKPLAVSTTTASREEAHGAALASV